MTVRLRKWALAGLLAAGGAAAAAVWTRRRLFAVTVEGHSMSPALSPGDRVLMRRGARGLRTGDLVVVAAPDPVTGWDPEAAVDTDLTVSGRFVKRVAALDGQPYPAALRRGGFVPSGHVIVLGDNPHSVDSKQYGPCPVTRILGVGIRAPFARHAASALPLNPWANSPTIWAVADSESCQNCDPAPRHTGGPWPVPGPCGGPPG